jgi:serine/threonine-protein kinase RsbW
VKRYYKEIPSNLDIIPELEDFITDIAAENNISEEHHNNLALSISEAAANCIVHGNKSDSNKKVRINVEVNRHKMLISLKDEGKGFKIKEVPDPTAPENILKDSGRGIFIMKSFLSDLRYNFTDSGTETILVYNLS